MADEKKISAKQAGIAVLKKFEELLLKASKEKNISVTDLTKAEELKKDDAPPPTIPGGTTINSAIGSPFGKAEAGPEWEAKRSELSHAKYHAEKKSKAAHDKLVDPMSLKQYMGHIHGKKYADYTVPAGAKHAQNLKDFHVAHKEHQDAIKAHKEHMASHPEMNKSEVNPDEKQDAELGEQVEKDVEQHMEQNPDAHPDHTRGHYKLAKFVGRVEGKKAAKGMNQDSGNDTPVQPVGQDPGQDNGNLPK